MSTLRVFMRAAFPAILFASALAACSPSSDTASNPMQLDVIGLIPGQSNKTDVERKKAELGYVIGGYELICIDEYHDGLLASFTCFTGEGNYSRDPSVEGFHLVSNLAVHNVLLEGFTRKFGKPSSIEDSLVQNALGNEFSQNQASWVDRQGNTLTLLSMYNQIDEGLLLLESAEQRKENVKTNIKKELDREF